MRWLYALQISLMRFDRGGNSTTGEDQCSFPRGCEGGESLSKNKPSTPAILIRPFRSNVGPVSKCSVRGATSSMADQEWPLSLDTFSLPSDLNCVESDIAHGCNRMWGAGCHSQQCSTLDIHINTANDKHPEGWFAYKGSRNQKNAVIPVVGDSTLSVGQSSALAAVQETFFRWWD